MCTTVPTLYVMCSLPFAHKSTIATALAEALGAEVVRLDAINHERGLGLNGRAISPEDWAISYTEADRRLERAGRRPARDRGRHSLSRAARAIIEVSLEGRTEPDELVTELDVLSTDAQTLALVRRMVVGESMLVDPVEWLTRPRWAQENSPEAGGRSALVLLNRHASGSNCWRADSHARASPSR